MAREYAWNLKRGQASRLSKVRLADNYLRFYLKFMAPEMSRIRRGMASLPPNLSSIFGLQFENLVLNNYLPLIRRLGLKPEDVVSEGPYFQRQGARYPGCQVDYMIETRYGTLFVCEMKFSVNRIGLSVRAEMEEKLARLKVPRNMSVRPVLIHVNGVTEELEWSNYFTRIVDFGELF